MNDGAVCPHVEGFHIQENTSLYGYYSECVSQPELTFVRTIYYSRLKKKDVYSRGGAQRYNYEHVHTDLYPVLSLLTEAENNYYW